MLLLLGSFLFGASAVSATPLHLISPPTRSAFTGGSVVDKRTTCPPPISPNLITSPSEPPPYAVSISSSSPIELGFTVPSDAVGPCSVMIDLTQVPVAGSAKINLYALDGPSPGSLVGTTLFQHGTKATINSFACREQMCFKLEVADDDDDGHHDEDGSSGTTTASSVSWEEKGGVGGGLRLDYGC